MNRRGFLKGAGASLALAAGCKTGASAFEPAASKGLAWSFLLHLGANMWEDIPRPSAPADGWPKYLKGEYLEHAITGRKLSGAKSGTGYRAGCAESVRKRSRRRRRADCGSLYAFGSVQRDMRGRLLRGGRRGESKREPTKNLH